MHIKQHLGILHCITLASVGGAERYFSECVGELARRVSANQSVLLAGPGIHAYYRETLSASDIRIYREKYWRRTKIPRWPRKLREWYWKGLASEHAPGVALFWNQLRASRQARACQQAGLSTVYWERGVGWHTPYENTSAQAMLRDVDEAMTNSRAGAHILHHRGYRKDVVVCRNAVRPSVFQAPDPAKWLPLDRPLRLGLASRLVPYKGVALALHTLKLAREQGWDINLWIAGQGPDLGRLRKLAKHLDIDPFVSFRGVVRDMCRFYDEIDCLLHPTLCEPCSNTLAEALCRGCPVVATNVDGTPEVVPDDCGVLVQAELEPGEYKSLGVSAEGQPPYIYDPVTGRVRQPKACSPEALLRGIEWTLEDTTRYGQLSRAAIDHARKAFAPEPKYEELLNILAAYVRGATPNAEIVSEP